jgi:hypothetical protein
MFHFLGAAIVIDQKYDNIEEHHEQHHSHGNNRYDNGLRRFPEGKQFIQNVCYVYR